MLHHQKTTWKNTIAFCILFDLHDINIDKSHNGLLHFAEHLMFVETKNIKANDLRIKFDLLFDTLYAHTSIDFLEINIVCSKIDLKEVCKILKEMIYHWKCDEDQFISEQRNIVEEIKTLENQIQNKATRSLDARIYDPKINIIGDVELINSFSYKDLYKIDNVWKKMLNLSSQHIIIAGATLTPDESKNFNNLCNKKKYLKPIKFNQTKIISSKYVSLPTVKAIIIKTNNSSPFFLILQRIFYFRHLSLNPKWDQAFTRETNNLVFFIYSENEKILDEKNCKKFLLNKPTIKEFLNAKNIVINHIESLLDGTNPEELIGWLDTFHIRNIPLLTGKSLLQIKNIFESIDYESFSNEWKIIFKNKYI